MGAQYLFSSAALAPQEGLRIASIIPSKLGKLLSYIKPQTVGAPARQRRKRDVNHIPQNHDAFNSRLHRPTKVRALSLRDRGKQVKNALRVTLVFLWTLVLTILIVAWATSSLLVPDKWRKARDLSSSVVLVTNAGRGLGRRLAIILALKAAMVVCWDPDQDRQMNTVYDIRHRGGRALGFTVDVSDEAAVTSAAEAMRRQVGAPGMVVMSAGLCPRRPLIHWTPTDLECIFRANVTPHLVLLRTFLPEMVARNDGHLVCIISASVSVPCWYDAAYAATKVSVAALMRGLIDELEMNPENKIRLTCVYPYHTERRPPLGEMANAVVSKVLRGRKHIVIPKWTVFWLKMLRALPILARRKWCWLIARVLRKEPERDFRKAYCPWGAICTHHEDMLAMLTQGLGRTPTDTRHCEGFVKYAPDEMASNTSFDEVPLFLKKRTVNTGTFEDEAMDDETWHAEFF